MWNGSRGSFLFLSFNLEENHGSGSNNLGGEERVSLESIFALDYISSNDKRVSTTSNFLQKRTSRHFLEEARHMLCICLAFPHTWLYVKYIKIYKYIYVYMYYISLCSSKGSWCCFLEKLDELIPYEFLLYLHIKVKVFSKESFQKKIAYSL